MTFRPRHMSGVAAFCTVFITTLISLFVMGAGLCAAEEKQKKLDLDQVRRIIHSEFPTFDVTNKIIAFEPLQEECFIEFRVSGIISGFTGITRQMNGRLRTYHKDPSRWIGASISVDATHPTTGLKMRDKAMQKALEVDPFPEIVFALESFTIEEVDYEDLSVRAGILGALALHGVSRPVELQVEGVITGGYFITSGSFTIKMSDYSIRRPRSPLQLFLVRVSDEVHIRFRIVWKLIEQNLFWSPAELRRYKW